MSTASSTPRPAHGASRYELRPGSRDCERVPEYDAFTLLVPRFRRKANALAPYVGSSVRPWCDASPAAVSPSAVGDRSLPIPSSTTSGLRMRLRDANVVAGEESSRPVRQAHRSPAVCDKAGRDADADDARRPAERRDREREAAAVPPVPSGRTIASGGTATARRAPTPRPGGPPPRDVAPPPGIQRRCPRAPARRHASSTARATILGPARERRAPHGPGRRRRRRGSWRVGLRELCEHGAATHGPRVHGGREAVARAGTAKVTKTVPGGAPASRNSSARTYSRRSARMTGLPA